jgi:hypothetical protein
MKLTALPALAALMTMATLVANASTNTIVTVRTYNYARVSDEDLARAADAAARIFEEAGISLEWIVCRVPGNAAGGSCTEPFAVGRDLMLRLRADTPAQSDPAVRVRPLGTSILDRGQHTGILMTLDTPPIRAIASGASIDFSTLLGRAIAHEVGHLLLGSGDHSHIGLMRALWSQDELRGAKPAHWGFSAEERARMRANLRQSSIESPAIGNHTLYSPHGLQSEISPGDSRRNSCVSGARVGANQPHRRSGPR